MINSLDMKEVSKISYNADTRKEVFRFDIIYRDGRTESKEIPLYVFDLEANKKVVNSEAINIANFVTESSKKINAVNDDFCTCLYGVCRLWFKRWKRRAHCYRGFYGQKGFYVHSARQNRHVFRV